MRRALRQKGLKTTGMYSEVKEKLGEGAEKGKKDNIFGSIFSFPSSLQLGLV